MSNTVKSAFAACAAADCAFADRAFAIAARLTGPELPGLAVVAVEAWLRLPLRPLLDFYVPKAQARATAWLRHLSS